MLQQTQVNRVLPKYHAFLKRFPTVHALAQAPLREVLIQWQGLGYNRRAKMLHACALEVVEKHKGRFPQTQEALVALPGIGPYTAGAVLAFAYNKPVVFIETNIRSVYLHHFFNDATQVTDRELLPFIERTLHTGDPRSWYYALMDYGVCIKKECGNPNTRSVHYTKQSAFKGSDRQIRGAIVRLLTEKEYTRNALHGALSLFEDARIDAQIEKLKKEGIVVQKKAKLFLP
jgi:A/G-specific adenine glycosylase